MAKVIVERPRVGSSLPSQKKGYLKWIQGIPLEDQPRREPMLGHWRGRQRWLNEHLGPMRRFLRSNVGRPWNKVHQDLCEHVSFANAVQSHVLDHIYDFVERRVTFINNRPCHSSGLRQGHPLREGHMYICPRTKLLRIAEQCPPRSLPERLHVTHSLIHMLKEGHWWEVCIREVPDDPDEFWDVWLEQNVTSQSKDTRIQAYGGNVFAVSKRALSRLETRQLLKRRREMSRHRSKRRSAWETPCVD